MPVDLFLSCLGQCLGQELVVHKQHTNHPRTDELFLATGSSTCLGARGASWQGKSIRGGASKGEVRDGGGARAAEGVR